MRKLPFVIWFTLIPVIYALCQTSPHGKDLKVSCNTCHSTSGWNIDPGIYSFDHNSTEFPLRGQHTQINCSSCHTNLIFSEARTECSGCHTDVHEQTVGNDCQGCHNPTSWLVNNITEIHQRTRFPLNGPHYTTDCSLCHKSESMLRFDPLGIECIDCHQADYASATEPNHIQGGYSTSCNECHFINSFTWHNASFNHSFFPLSAGHDHVECSSCHTGGNYAKIPSDCNSCHQSDYLATTDPNHSAADFPVTCENCHTTAPGWQPAQYRDHDSQFPIYSGKHNMQWNKCSDCHTSSTNYSVYSCTVCHTHNQQDMNDAHQGIGGYAYNDAACFACHPTGTSEGGFDHNTTIFPLTGGHVNVDCANCHTSGYAGTSTVCADCHISNYSQTSNPNHSKDGISTSCADCHTTITGWSPAAFPVHNNYFVLDGGHATISDNCDQCHNGNYKSTPNTCESCHTPDYNQTSNPNHSTIGISKTCEECHTTQPGWRPAAFPNHNTFFAFTGAHTSISDNCVDCHNNNYVTTPNTCEGCHISNYNSTVNPNHNSTGIPTTCATCHTTDPGWKPATFPIHNNYYQLTGAHTSIAGNCTVCHNGDYNSTPNTCEGCHLKDYNSTSNPSHVSAQFPLTCDICHTTNAWTPSTFEHDAQYFPIYSGTHLGQWTSCSDCHINPGNFSVFSCTDCHAHNQTDMDSKHAGISSYVYNSASCLSCHPTGAQAFGFDHNTTSFALTGAHLTTDCNNCHSSGYSGITSVCSGCHISSYNSTTDPNHSSLGFSTTCETCHTTNPGWAPASFTSHNNYYPLTGAHLTTACSACHTSGYAGTSTLCTDCHLSNYNQTANPVHSALAIPTTCQTCHTTAPGWKPAAFPIHDNYYVLAGAHLTIAANCAACHNGNYNNTPNTCAGCHLPDYNATTNPAHAIAQFPTACQTCHSQNAWSPSSFNHDAMYFPIYTGKHNGAWTTCSECHPNSSNFAVYTCITCHAHNQTDMNDAHSEVTNYSYSSDRCLACHPAGNAGGRLIRMKDVKVN